MCREQDVHQGAAYLKGSYDNHWLAAGSSEAKFDLCFHLCLTSNLTKAHMDLPGGQSKCKQVTPSHLWVMNKTLPISRVGWQLARTSLLETLYYGLQQACARSVRCLRIAKGHGY